MTYNTGNALGSTDPRDLYDNAENLDKLANGPALTYADRLGVPRKSWKGMEQDFQAFLLASGYQDLGAYAAGLNITARNQVFLRSGEYYRAAAGLALPYTTTGVWASEASSFVGVGDAQLRQEIAGFGLVGVSAVHGDGVTDVSSALAAANAAGKPIRISGVCVVGTPTTITMPIVDTLEQIFAENASVTINNGQPVRPEWFGWSANNITRAVNALPAAGGVVQLEARRYPRSYSMDKAGQGAGIAYLAKPNVKIMGRGVPVADSGYTQLIGGTSIDGPFSVFADGFYGDGFGVDCGAEVIARLWGGIEPDAFNMAATSETGGRVTRAGLGKIAVMGARPGAQMHGLLVQGHSYFSFDAIHAYTCAHGVAIKSEFVQGGMVRGVGNEYEALILKANTTTPMRSARVDSVHATGLSAFEPGYGCIIQAADADCYNISVGSVLAQNKFGGLQLSGQTAALSATDVGSVSTENCKVSVNYDGNVRESKVSAVSCKLTEHAVTGAISSGTRLNSIGMLSQDGFDKGVLVSGYLRIDSYRAYSLVNTAANIPSGSSLAVGDFDAVGVGAKTNLAFTVSAGWSSAAEFTLGDYGVKMAGYVYASGTSVTILAAGSVPAGMRPASDVRLVCPTTTGPAVLIAGADGSLSVQGSVTTGSSYYLDGLGWKV